MGNAIEEDPELGPPGPVFVDDFYYDYNFINFHEDLSYGPFEEPDPDLAGAGHWTPPPLSSPAEPPISTRLPASEAPGTEKEGALGESPAPWPSLSLPPPSEQTPGNPLVNFLPEEDAPARHPDLGLPSWPWPPASVSGTKTPAATWSLPGGEDSQSQTPAPRQRGTNELSELSQEEEEGGEEGGEGGEEGEALDHGGTSLPPGSRPMSPPLPSFSTTRTASSPGAGDPWTVGTVAWEPPLEGGLGPGDTELQPPVGRAPFPPPAALPATTGRDGPLEPGTPTPPAPWHLQTAAVPGTFLLSAPLGLEHTFWGMASGPGPMGQPEAPGSEVPPSPVLPPTPAQDGSANNSRAPEAQPLDPSLTQDLPPARNASWEVGNWSEVRGAGVHQDLADCFLFWKRLPSRCLGVLGFGNWQPLTPDQSYCPPCAPPGQSALSASCSYLSSKRGGQGAHLLVSGVP